MPSMHPRPAGLDTAIVELLRHDGRATYETIGRAVGLSASAAKRRVDRLERSGVIRGYAAIVDDAQLGGHLEAFAQLTFVGDTNVEDIAGVGRGIREIETIYTTAGDPDALALIRVQDVAHLTAVINRLRQTGMVSGTKTLLVLDTWRPDARTVR